MMAFDDVVAIQGDAAFWCLRHARKEYGDRKIDKVITGIYKKEPLDDEGNPLYACLEGQNAEDLQNQVCDALLEGHTLTPEEQKRQGSNFDLDGYLCPNVKTCFPGIYECQCVQYDWQKHFLLEHSVVSPEQYYYQEGKYREWYCHECMRTIEQKEGVDTGIVRAQSSKNAIQCDECERRMFTSEESRDKFYGW